MKEKKAILVVSSGTSRPEAIEKAVGGIENRIRESFPDMRICRAFSSRRIIHKLRQKENLQIDNVEEALARLHADGVEQVIVQPTHVLNGIENDRMLECLMEYMGDFSRIRIGRPLLSSADDYKKVVHAVMEEAPLNADETLVLVGHGTDHHANSAYPTLEYTFHALGYERVLVGTIGGFPELKNVITKLKISGYTKVLLMPFMIAAGKHAAADMAGGEDSWMSALRAEGCETRAVLTGLGEFKGIQNLFVEHIEDVL